MGSAKPTLRADEAIGRALWPPAGGPGCGASFFLCFTENFRDRGMLPHSNTRVPDEELTNERWRQRCGHVRVCAHGYAACVDTDMCAHVSAHVCACTLSRRSNPVPVCVGEHWTAKLDPSNVGESI